MSIVYKYICGILIVLLTGYFFYTKDFSNKYDKVIMAEGLGYYVYLPATFIYHDYTFQFFNEVYPKYYNPGYNPPTGNFIRTFDGVSVNKYYPGVAILWLPFFLIAHLLALLLHLPADGFSDMYQYGIGMAGIFYTWLGLKFTKKTLTHFKIPPVIQVFTLSILLFGTNMLLYASTWSSQTHCYSFFLIAAFFWFIIRLVNDEYDKKNQALMWSFILLAFTMTLRPQNIAILLLLPFFGFTKKSFSSILKNNLFTISSAIGMLIGFLLIARVSYVWYIQTGKLFLNPYHGEHYYFNKPHVLAVLFSFRQGWLVYSPFVAIALAGIFFFKRNSDKINLFIFWAPVIYVSSCWWCWTYGATSYGQRPFIDYYCIIALQAAIFLNYFYQRRLKLVSQSVALVVIPLSLLQTHQYKYAIIANENEQAENYFENFFEIHPVAQYPIPPACIQNKEEHFFSFDDYIDSTRTGNVFYSGKGASFVSVMQPINEKKFFKLPAYMVPGFYSIIRCTAMIKRTSDDGNELLVIDFIRNGKVVSSNPYWTKYFTHRNEWTKFQSGLEVPQEALPGDSISIYFKRVEGNDVAYIDDLKVEFIHADSSYIQQR